MPVTVVSDPAALIAALNSAQAGDTVALAAGNYAHVTLSKLNFGSAVTITSADPAAGATITGLSVDACSGLAFRGLTIVSDPAEHAPPNVVSDSANISFGGIWFHGSLNNDPSDDLGGLQIRGSTDVSIVGSTFEQLYWGISHLDDTRLVILGNEFHDLRMDGIRGGGSSYVTISSNSFRDFHIVDGDHGDVIQFWTTNTTASAHDIAITDNVFVRGAGYFVQGICLRDEVGNLPYERVVISRNLLAGGTFNGITVGNSHDVAIVGNVVQPFGDQASYIRVDHVDGLTFADNAAGMVKALTSSSVTETGTKVLSAVNDAGVAALQTWTAAHMVSFIGSPLDEVLVGSAMGSLMRGAEGNDILLGGANFDDINGNQGNDTASGGAGDDWIVGGMDNDVLAGDAGSDIVYGNLGNDTCDGGDGNDIIRGGQDNDSLSGGGGADFLSGDKGDDTLAGGAGADVFHTFGDAGFDRVLDFSLAQGDRVQLDPGTVFTVGQVGLDTIIDMAGGGRLILAGVDMSTLTPGWILAA